MKKKNVKSSISSQHHSNDQPNYYTPHRMKESSSCTKPSVHDQANHHHHKIEIKAVKGK